MIIVNEQWATCVDCLIESEVEFYEDYCLHAINNNVIGGKAITGRWVCWCSIYNCPLNDCTRELQWNKEVKGDETSLSGEMLSCWFFFFGVYWGIGMWKDNQEDGCLFIGCGILSRWWHEKKDRRWKLERLCIQELRFVFLGNKIKCFHTQGHGWVKFISLEKKIETHRIEDLEFGK